MPVETVSVTGEFFAIRVFEPGFWSITSPVGTVSLDVSTTCGDRPASRIFRTASGRARRRTSGTAIGLFSFSCCWTFL